MDPIIVSLLFGSDISNETATKNAIYWYKLSDQEKKSQIIGFAQKSQLSLDDINKIIGERRQTNDAEENLNQIVKTINSQLSEF